MGPFPRRIPAATLFALVVLAAPATAQQQYDPGVSDTEIKIGNIVPASGLFSDYGAIGRAEAAYFQMVNDLGGVNGRKITFVSLDNGSEVSNTPALAKQGPQEPGEITP